MHNLKQISFSIELKVHLKVKYLIIISKLSA